MKRIVRGDLRMSYSEVLRVIGSYIDRNDLSDIRVLEIDEGLVVQGRLTGGPRAGEIDTYQLSVEDIEGLLLNAYALRGKKTIDGGK